VGIGGAQTPRSEKEREEKTAIHREFAKRPYIICGIQWLNMEHYTWDEMEKEILSPTIGRKIVTGEKAMIAQVFLAKGAVVPEHHHESEQITYILEGALEFHLEGKTVVVSAGQVLRIPSNVPHMAIALEDTLDLDIFSPIRHDWLTKDDAYLRK
jgi:quercetin dioxygenase-like cupin family protein